MGVSLRTESRASFFHPSAVKALSVNRFLSAPVTTFGICTLTCVFLLFGSRKRFEATTDALNQTILEFNRLQNLAASPDELNLEIQRSQAAAYGSTVGKLKEEIKAQVLPVLPMQPNEFQARLRGVVTAITDRAHGNRVLLPDNFFLGFNQFAAALPDRAVASSLGQRLAQAEVLAGILIDARIDALRMFRFRSSRRAMNPSSVLASSRLRRPKSEQTSAPGVGPVEGSAIEMTFLSTPSAARRVLNQIAGAHNQVFVIRLLHIVNEKDKGPPRRQMTELPNVVELKTAPDEPTGRKPGAALDFIVGMERIQTSLTVELVKLNF